MRLSNTGGTLIFFFVYSFLPSQTGHPTNPPPVPHNPHGNYETALRAIGLHADKAAEFCYDRLATSAPANISLSGVFFVFANIGV